MQMSKRKLSDVLYDHIEIIMIITFGVILVVGTIAMTYAVKDVIKDNQITEASKYSVAGTVEGFRIVDEDNSNDSWFSIGSGRSYYVTIDGKEYPIDRSTKQQLQKGQWVSIDGDRNGVNRLETKE